MHGVNTAYTVWMNRRNQRTGHLFEGRYKAIAVDDEGYFLAVSAYVHLNPVRVKGWEDRPPAERLERIEKYPWSSFPDYTQSSRQQREPTVDCDPIWRELDAETRREGCKRYREYIKQRLAQEDPNPFADLKRGCYLGGPAFGEFIERLFTKDEPLSDQVVAYREWRNELPAEEVIRKAAEAWGVGLEEVHAHRKPNPARDVVAYLCREAAHKELKEIGEVLGVKAAAVSLATKRVRDRLAEDRRFQKQVEGARSQLIKILKT